MVRPRKRVGSAASAGPNKRNAHHNPAGHRLSTIAEEQEDEQTSEESFGISRSTVAGQTDKRGSSGKKRKSASSDVDSDIDDEPDAKKSKITSKHHPEEETSSSETDGTDESAEVPDDELDDETGTAFLREHISLIESEFYKGPDPPNGNRAWRALAKKFPQRSCRQWTELWPRFCVIEWQRRVRGIEDEEAKLEMNALYKSMRRSLRGPQYAETPAMFLRERQWEDWIATLGHDDEEKEKWLKLQALSRKDVLDGGSDRPQGPGSYTHFENWDLKQAVSPPDEKDFWIDARQVMLVHVVEGKISRPQSFQDYFYNKEWETFRHDCPDEDCDCEAALRQCKLDMMGAVVNQRIPPYTPEQHLQTTYWRGLIQDAVDEGAAADLRRLYECMVDDVLLQQVPPYKLDMAECRDHWKQLHDSLLAEDLTDGQKKMVADIHQLVKTMLLNWYGDQLPEPPAWDQTAPLRAFIGNTSDYISEVEKANVILEWTDSIRDAADDRHRAELVSMMATMTTNQGLYRPREAPLPPGSAPLPAQDVEVHYEAETKDIGFDNDRIPGVWQYGQRLGSGTYGFVSQWLTLSPHGSVVERIAIKDTYNVWDSPDFWEGDIEYCWPLEYAIVADLNALKDSDNIIRFLDHKPYEEKRMFRIYMEYCEYGTLEDLIAAYREKKERRLLDQNRDPIDFRMPARLIWSVFEGLVNALCLMHYANLPDIDEEDKAADWPFGGIMHRDLKPANILLATEDQDETIWPGMPVTKVADFGLAVRRLESATADDVGYGTPGYRAPEMIPAPPNADDDDGSRQPGLYSDIWVIGRIILSLMNLDRYHDITEFTLESPGDRPGFGPGVEDFYGEEMCEIVKGCLRKSTTARSDAWSLYEEVKRVVAIGHGRKGKPMRETGKQAGEIYWHTGPEYVKWARE